MSVLVEINCLLQNVLWSHCVGNYVDLSCLLFLHLGQHVSSQRVCFDDTYDAARGDFRLLF